MSGKKQTRFFIAYVIFVIISFIILFKLHWDYQGRTSQGYIPITSQTGMGGRILKLNYNRGLGIVLNDGNRYFVKSEFLSRDDDRYPSKLKVGDSIFKKANNDTLVVVRDGISTVYIKRPGDW